MSERYADMLGKFLEDICPTGADRKVALGNDSSKAGRTAHLVLVGGLHDVAPQVTDAQVGPDNRVAGYVYAEWLSARGLTDSAEARRDWRAGK